MKPEEMDKKHTTQRININEQDCPCLFDFIGSEREGAIVLPQEGQDALYKEMKFEFDLERFLSITGRKNH